MAGLPGGLRAIESARRGACPVGDEPRMAQTDGVAGVVLTTPPHRALVAPAITPNRADLPIARLMASNGPRTAVERLHGGLAGRASGLGLSLAMQTGVERLATVPTAVESWAPGLAGQATSRVLSVAWYWVRS